MNPTPEPITTDDVEYVAKLARLEFSDAELEMHAHQLAEILAYVWKLNEVDTSGIEPLYRVNDIDNVLRDDVVIPSSAADGILLNAPAKTGLFFAMPNVRRKSP